MTIKLDENKYTKEAILEIKSNPEYQKDYFSIEVSSLDGIEKFDAKVSEEGIYSFSNSSKNQTPSIYFFEKSKWKVLDAMLHVQNIAPVTLTNQDISFASKEEVDEVFDEHRTFLVCKAQINDNVDKGKLAKAAKLEDVDPDLLPVSFKLVHANQNKNKDAFDKADLSVAKDTPKLKPLNWQHAEPIIGVMYDSEFVEASSEEDAHLLVDSVVYKYRYPEYANEIVDRYNEDNLYFSMEVWFTEAECSVCHHVASKKEDYCEHLKSRTMPGSTASRILRGIVFGGAGVVDNPADTQAKSVSLGNNNSKEENVMPKNNEGNIVFDSQAELDALIQSKVDEAIKAGEKDEKIETLEAEIANLKEEMEKVSKELEAEKANTAKLQEEKAAVEADFATFKEDLEKENAAKARINELTEAGVVIPETNAEKIFKSVKEMTEEAYTMYKDMLVASIAASKAEEESNAESNEAEESNTAQVDVPNGSQASNNQPFQSLRKILDKTGTKKESN